MAIQHRSHSKYIENYVTIKFPTSSAQTKASWGKSNYAHEIIENCMFFLSTLNQCVLISSLITAYAKQQKQELIIASYIL